MSTLKLSLGIVNATNLHHVHFQSMKFMAEVDNIYCKLEPSFEPVS